MIAAIGCASDPLTVRAPAPTIDVATVEASPINVLSAVMRVRARDADSVAVRFHNVGSTDGDSVTPAVAVFGGGDVVVPVL